MKIDNACAGCGAVPSLAGPAIICTCGSSYCESCAAGLQPVCQQCGRTLQSASGRTFIPPTPSTSKIDEERRSEHRILHIWLFSLIFWSLVAVIAAWTMYQWRRSLGMTAIFSHELIVPAVTEAVYVVLTPLTYLAAYRYPITRKTLGRRLPLYVIGGIVFVVLFIVMRVLLYPVRVSTGGVRGLFEKGGLDFQVFKNAFFYNFADTIVSIYMPTVIVAHAIRYHQTSKATAIRAAELSKQLAQAKLQTLEMQLHPHFLFNTMNSISALMHIDVNQADKMMSQFSDLLRMTLANRGDAETTLKDEVDFLSSYLNIEQTRLGNRLEVTQEIDPIALDALIPHLLLQPVIENAIRHGIAKKIEGGRLSISAKRDGHKLQLKVSDNGPGFNPNSVGTGGLGRKITKERLEALYGEDSIFHTFSEPGQGTAVIIELPFKRKQRKAMSDLPPALALPH